MVKKGLFYPHNFSASFFRRLTYTNPNILRDAKQWVKVLLLFLLFLPYVFDSSRTTQSAHHHCNGHCYHAIFLFADLFQTSLEHILTAIDIF